jgi:GNAT superfamily N-acetyltransferase
MKPVDTFAQVMAAFRAARQGARDFQANLFPSPEKIETWIRRRSLLHEDIGGTHLFVRRTPELDHLYFFAPDRPSLETALGAWRTPAVAVADVIGKGTGAEDTAACFRRAGFSLHKTLVRMFRAPVEGDTRPPEAPDVEPALPADTAAVSSFLRAVFDPLCDQIPDEAETAEAIAAGGVWVIRERPGLAALIHFERQGQVAQIRYWAVAAGGRNRGTGARLMRTALRLTHPRRVYLWVIQTNADAIAKYRHYGFAEDGLEDRVMVRPKETS